MPSRRGQHSVQAKCPDRGLFRVEQFESLARIAQALMAELALHECRQHGRA
jgi:hypothetical protein